MLWLRARRRPSTPVFTRPHDRDVTTAPCGDIIHVCAQLRPVSQSPNTMTSGVFAHISIFSCGWCGARTRTRGSCGIRSGAQMRDGAGENMQDPDCQRIHRLRRRSVTGLLSPSSRGWVMMSTLSRKRGTPQRSWCGFCGGRRKLWPGGSWSGPQRQRGPAG